MLKLSAFILFATVIGNNKAYITDFLEIAQDNLKDCCSDSFTAESEKATCLESVKDNISERLLYDVNSILKQFTDDTRDEVQEQLIENIKTKGLKSDCAALKTWIEGTTLTPEEFGYMAGLAWGKSEDDNAKAVAQLLLQDNKKMLLEAKPFKKLISNLFINDPLHCKEFLTANSNVVLTQDFYDAYCKFFAELKDPEYENVNFQSCDLNKLKTAVETYITDKNEENLKKETKTICSITEEPKTEGDGGGKKQDETFTNKQGSETGSLTGPRTASTGTGTSTGENGDRGTKVVNPVTV